MFADFLVLLGFLALAALALVFIRDWRRQVRWRRRRQSQYALGRGVPRGRNDDAPIVRGITKRGR